VRVASMEAHEARIRSQAEAELARQMRGKPVRRLLLMQFIRKTRVLLRNRESARLDRTRIIGIFRRFYRTLGRRLADEGTLASPADIYYLTEDEVSEIVHASSVFGDVKELHAVIERRRAMIDASRARQLPERLTFRGTGIRNPVPQIQAASELAGSAGLSGTPCSPGVVDAEAVVIVDPSAAPDVKGKIIIARTTDPGWVFLMIASSGLIVERGSLLSHTAIIGRELGIPTIVGVRDATSHIRTGQRIRMDASTGHIDVQPS